MKQGMGSQKALNSVNEASVPSSLSHTKRGLLLRLPSCCQSAYSLLKLLRWWHGLISILPIICFFPNEAAGARNMLVCHHYSIPCLREDGRYGFGVVKESMQHS